MKKIEYKEVFLAAAIIAAGELTNPNRENAGGPFRVFMNALADIESAVNYSNIIIIKEESDDVNS